MINLYIMEIIDTHSHIQFPAYDTDRDEVIKRAHEAGVKMIAIGTQVSTSREGVKSAEKYPEDILGATAGFHPGHLDAEEHFDKDELRENVKEKFDIDALREVAKDKHILAIGECGLDYYRLPSDAARASQIKEKQKEVFLAQIKLAKELDKPLVIHCRSAFPDLINLLVANRQSLVTIPGVIHFFSGTKDEARQLMDLGFYIAFGGVITFTKDYDEVVRFVPLERIVLETDAPYVAPAPYRGKRNEPAFIVETAKKVAELNGVDYKKVVDLTIENTKNLFQTH